MDQDGYQVVKRSKTLGHYMPEIFAVDAAPMRVRIKDGTTKNNHSGEYCAKKRCDRRDHPPPLMGELYACHCRCTLRAFYAQRVCRMQL